MSKLYALSFVLQGNVADRACDRNSRSTLLKTVRLQTLDYHNCSGAMVFWQEVLSRAAKSLVASEAPLTC